MKYYKTLRRFGYSRIGSVIYLVRFYTNRLIYGIPRLCAKHTLEHKARTQILDSENCIMCKDE